jgi:hypothetical protein
LSVIENTIRLAADQGEAMRCLIYHCTAAIVGAIVDHKNATKRLSLDELDRA